MLNFKVYYPSDIASDPIGWNVYCMRQKLLEGHIPGIFFLQHIYISLLIWSYNM